MDIKINKPEKLIKALIHNIQGMSFGSAQKMIRLGKIKVNGKKVKDNISLNIGDKVDVDYFQKSIPNVPILYEDNNILIINKPSGIECATRDKSSDNTYSLEEIFAEKNATIVHRLDRQTSGLVILARSKQIAILFEKYFRNRMIDKHYFAGVFGSMHNINGIKKAYLHKDEKKSIVDISDVPKDGYKEIVTEFNLHRDYEKFSLIDIKLHTGRTHQIRAHLSHLGYPIIGDNKYSKNTNPFGEYKGYFLTAYKIKFNLVGELEYLNDIDITIEPEWLKYLEQ